MAQIANSRLMKGPNKPKMYGLCHVLSNYSNFGIHFLPWKLPFISCLYRGNVYSKLRGWPVVKSTLSTGMILIRKLQVLQKHVFMYHPTCSISQNHIIISPQKVSLTNSNWTWKMHGVFQVQNLLKVQVKTPTFAGEPCGTSGVKFHSSLQPLPLLGGFLPLPNGRTYFMAYK